MSLFDMTELQEEATSCNVLSLKCNLAIYSVVLIKQRTSTMKKNQQAASVFSSAYENATFHWMHKGTSIQCLRSSVYNVLAFMINHKYWHNMNSCMSAEHCGVLEELQHIYTYYHRESGWIQVTMHYTDHIWL